MEPPRKFIILTQPRTGSTFACHLLESHPHAYCYQELFSHVEGHSERFNTFLGNLRKEQVGFTSEDLPALVTAYLSAIHSLPGFRAIGFKLLLDQLVKYPSLADWIDAENVHIIHLIRDNPLEILLSKTRARQTNEWHSSKDVAQCSSVLPSGQPLLNELEAIVQTDLDIQHFVRGRRHTTIHYDDLVESPKDALLPSLLALGLGPAGLSSPTKKLNRLPLREAIENFEEVAETLTGTTFEALLENAPAKQTAEKAPPIVFLNIPGTGGESFEHVLRARFGAKSVFMAYPHINGPIENFITQDYRTKKTFQAISGDFTYNILYFMPNGSRFICIIMNPIHRAIRAYSDFIKENNKLLNNKISLADFSSPHSGFNQDNLQTKYIAGAKLDMPCTHEIYEIALHNMQSMNIMVGVKEMKEETRDYFSKIMKPTSNCEIYRKKDIDTRFIGNNEMLALSRHNEFDIKLYAEAVNNLKMLTPDSLPERLELHEGIPA